MSAQEPVEVLAKRFADAAAALAVALSDQLQASDPEAHAQLQAALAEGIPIALSLVTTAAGGPCIQLDLVNGDGERLRVITLPGRGGARH